MDIKGLLASNIFLLCLIGQKPIPAMKVACAACNVCYSPSYWRTLEPIRYQTVAAFGAAHPARQTGKCQRVGRSQTVSLGMSARLCMTSILAVQRHSGLPVNAREVQ